MKLTKEQIKGFITPTDIGVCTMPHGWLNYICELAVEGLAHREAGTVDDKKLTKMFRYILSYQWLLNKQSSMAGQGFTDWTCLRCDINHTHPNTNVPILCKSCDKDILTQYLDEHG